MLSIVYKGIAIPLMWCLLDKRGNCDTSDKILKELPRGRAYLVDQLQRAASSIALNIAEGAGEYARHEKHRFYRMAKRSATECAAILDIGLKLGLIETKKLSDARELLFRIVSMLIKMMSPTH